MADVNRILTLLGEAAKLGAAMGVPGAAAAPAVINGVRAAATAFDNFKAANGGRSPAPAQADRDAALQRVLARAESTARRLEGG